MGRQHPKPKSLTVVSDHAVLRYLERVGGFNIDTLRAQIAERVGARALPGAKAVVIEGFRYHLAIGEGNGALVVTTITPIEG